VDIRLIGHADFLIQKSVNTHSAKWQCLFMHVDHFLLWQVYEGVMKGKCICIFYGLSLVIEGAADKVNAHFKLFKTFKSSGY
jgi:hypothetical protein